MAKGTYEQPPVRKVANNECVIRIQKTGDPMVDANAVNLYSDLGYTFGGEKANGVVEMTCSPEHAKAISQRGIDLHYSRANGARNVNMEGTAKLVQNDTIRSTNPMTADQLMAEMGVASVPDED